jgi:adenylosuccinate lyase
VVERYSLPDMAAIWSEDNKFRKWLDVELAIADALAEIGEIPAEAARVMREKGRVDAAEIAEVEKTTDHDVIAFIKVATRDMGEAEAWFHHGVTSTDIVDTAQAIQLTEAVDLLLSDLEGLEAAMTEQARKHKDTLMIGRTHGIHAEPITFGLKLAVWIAEVRRNRERLTHARKTMAVGQISGAVGTYANIDPRVEEIACRALGLEPSPASTQTLQRDRHAELLSTMAVIAGSLEKFATEIRNLQRTDLLEAEEYFKPGQRGSSAMPHKRNPITAERVAGMARVIRGYAVTALENQALWHERDITHSSAERIILPDATLLLHYMLRKLTDVIARLIVYPENMLRNVERTRGLVASQRVMLALTEKGMSREDSYKTVQKHALAAWNGNGDFRSNLESDAAVTAVLSPADLDELFDYRYFTRHVGRVFERLGI